MDLLKSMAKMKKRTSQASNVMRLVLLASFVILLFCPSAYAATVYVKEGNVFFEDDGKVSQITSSGRDEKAILNPSGTWICFVRNLYQCDKDKCTPLKGVDVKDGNLKQELWRVKTNGQNAAMLFLSKESAGVVGDNQSYSFASIENIQFSPSGDKVYFETPNWVTSAGLHVMNADGSGEKLLGAGNDTKIILSSSGVDSEKHNGYQGYIVTDQHRYWYFGGSYDWYYLFTPDFKEVGPLGDDPNSFTDIGQLRYTDHSETKTK